MLFQTAVVGAVVFGALTLLFFHGPLPSLLNLGLLFSLGVTGGLGHFLFTAAYRQAPASLLSPVNYLELVWAGLIGWAVFGHVPDPLTTIGMCVVAAAGAIAALRSYRSNAPPSRIADEFEPPTI
jgi:drug/metabolite transporter (DMT)-like permease